jgi:hypothetical protein
MAALVSALNPLYYKSTFEIAIQIHSFKNVELFTQGLYKVRIHGFYIPEEAKEERDAREQPTQKILATPFSSKSEFKNRNT